MSAPDDDARARRVLGWGVRCDPVAPGTDVGRDLVLRRAAGGLDLDVVAGVECLAQDLAVGLTTLRGSDVLATAFGFAGLAALAEETVPVLVQERIRVAVVDLLARDPRVRGIVDIKFTDDRLEAPVPGSRDLNVRVTFETISDDRVAIDLGRPAPDA